MYKACTGTLYYTTCTCHRLFQAVTDVLNFGLHRRMNAGCGMPRPLPSQACTPAMDV